MESEARVNAERLQADALNRAEKLDKDIESRRADMFGDLQKQREDLDKAVTALRTFEATYRRNLTNHLRSQIKPWSPAVLSHRTCPKSPAGATEIRAISGRMAPRREGQGGIGTKRRPWRWCSGQRTLA